MAAETKANPLRQLEGFVKQLQIIASGDLEQNLSKVLAENISLRTQAEELRITNAHTMKHAAGLQAFIEELKTKLKEKSELVKTLTQDAKTLEEGNKALGTNVKSLQDAAAVAEQSARQREAELAKTLEELQRRAAEAGDGAATLNKQNGELRLELEKYEGVNDKAEKLLAAEREAAACKTESQGLRQELDVLKSMTMPLQRPDHEAFGCQLLELTNSTTLLVATFFDDIPASVLDDARSWSPLRSHPVVGMAIPLPASNSRAARLMRTSAVLAVCSDALLSHVFQPTYITQDGDEMAALLQDLAAADPAREALVRAVLLPLVPGQQDLNGVARARRAVAEVVGHVGGLLAVSQPHSQHQHQQQQEQHQQQQQQQQQQHDRQVSAHRRLADFQAKLEEIFLRASHTWKTAQRSTAKMQPSFDQDHLESWLLLRPGSPVPGYDKMMAPTNGIRPPPSPSPFTQTRGHANSNTTTTTTTNGNTNGTGTSPRTIRFIVWPAFFAAENGPDLRLVCKGLALDESHMKPARDEETAMAYQGTRRVPRQGRRARTLSVSEGVPLGRSVAVERNGHS